ncbi:ABC transporter ATP-binding protein [Streptococcus sp. zg-JUN1979]|uniref:ABC transporter ATP-binding protein n=1 Tax=Streptococcus sp. zg-JUN1979 TaxID=3391450 RepID=UPI0039A61E24
MILRTQNLGYSYTEHPDDYLFKDVNLSFETGQVYSILGQSGSGKTTFLSLLAGLDSPKEGAVFLDDVDISQKGLTHYRQHRVATIFQSYNLLTYMTARQNVKAALAISGKKSDDQAISELFKRIGISEDLMDKPVLKLSGGQQQRVAIVRAIATGHDVIIADEPTGNLDDTTTQDIMSIFKDIAHQQGKIVIIVTHERDVADNSDVIYQLKHKTFRPLSKIT